LSIVKIPIVTQTTLARLIHYGLFQRAAGIA
jgi:hypothetical protein